MIVLEVNNVSILYLTGDFKDIGIKEYITRKLTHNYHIKINQVQTYLRWQC